MNDQLAKSISEVVDLSKEGLIKGLQLVETQVPELCQQILNYGFYINLIAPIMLFVCGSILLLSFKSKQTYYTDNSYPTGKLFMVMIFGIATFVASIVFFIESLPTLMKITLAPKLYLIEYLANLL